MDFISYKLYNDFGSFVKEDGVFFRLYAPNAKDVSVVGDFNHYEPFKDSLTNQNGVWEGFVKGAKKGDTYKYAIQTYDDRILYKADPFARYFETPPKSASIIWDIEGYEWRDEEWMKQRGELQRFDKPLCIYEVHLLSWKKELGNYKEIAYELARYIKELGFSHIEILPITEFPFEGSWGYQALGYFAPTARLGSPQDFMEFVDVMHQEGIGVIMDWVPSHFVTDGHGLINFDGTCLYEYEDPRKGYHPEWGSMIFDYSKEWVRKFLISSASFFIEKYHIDGIRVDAVASMLYLDYGRKPGEWIPNIYGGNENLEAIGFLKELNGYIKNCYKDVIMSAEESTAFANVTAPIEEGGLGFDYKWNMGWMHDTLNYFKIDPLFRTHHHDRLTFTLWYAFNEHYILPLSHDEVVHMKGSLLNKMPGFIEKFPNLKALFSYMYAHPGKKLLFMGAEIAQYSEWNFADELDWYLLQDQNHKAVWDLLKDLNHLYKSKEALWSDQQESFEWIDMNESKDRNIISFLRKNGGKEILVVCNFANIEQEYIVGVPKKGEWEEIFNSQDEKYLGNGISNKRVYTISLSSQGYEQSLKLRLPHLSVLYMEFLK